MGVMCAQSPLESELIQRCQQLQSRLSTLKIENDEVGHVSFLLLVLFIHLASHTFHLRCVLIPACFISLLPFRWRKPWRLLCPPFKTWWLWRTMMSPSASSTATAWSQSNPLVNPISANPAWPSDGPISRRRSSFTSQSVPINAIIYLAMTLVINVHLCWLERIICTNCNFIMCVFVCVVEAEGVSGRQEPDHQAGGQAWPHQEDPRRGWVWLPECPSYLLEVDLFSFPSGWVFTCWESSSGTEQDSWTVWCPEAKQGTNLRDEWCSGAHQWATQGSRITLIYLISTCSVCVTEGKGRSKWQWPYVDAAVCLT